MCIVKDSRLNAYNACTSWWAQMPQLQHGHAVLQKFKYTHTHTGQQQYTKSKWTTDDYQCHIPQSLSSCCGLLLPNTYRWTWRKIAFLISHKVWPYSQKRSLNNSKPEMGRTHTHIHSHSPRWIQISPCHVRYTARPQWASSLNQKSIISFILSSVIIGPNQRLMHHGEFINDWSNKNWLMGMIMIM